MKDFQFSGKLFAMLYYWWIPVTILGLEQGSLPSETLRSGSLQIGQW